MAADPAPLKPAASALPAGRPSDRRGAVGDDVIAALIVTVLLVPQSLAYALLAGLPPVVGVMASLLPILAYAAFGSSSTLAVGPVAVLSMMTAQAVLPAAQTLGVEPHLAAMVLAIEIAVVFIVAAALRLDVFAALLSAPVLHGFITGAAVVIAIGQLPQLLGIALKGQTLSELLAAAAAAPELLPHAPTAAIGLTALALLWLIRSRGGPIIRRIGFSARAAQLATRIAPMLVVVLAIGWIALAPAANTGVALAGTIDLLQGLHFTPFWQAPPAVWQAMAGPALLLGLVGYVESLAVAEALAARRGERIAPRRELVGLAAANAAAGISGGMPVTGGFARSIVNFDAGARTRMAGVWTVLFLAIAVFLLGDALRFLPKAVLAATIIIAVLSLVDLHPFTQAWRYSRAEFGLMLAVAALTVLVGVEAALSLGVIGAVALLLQRTARPHWAEVGRLRGTEVFRNVKRHKVDTLPNVLAIRIDQSLLFTNSRWLADTLIAAPVERPGLEHVVLMMSGVNDIDLSGLEALMQLCRDLKVQGVSLHMSELKGPVEDKLLAADLRSWLSGHVFRTQHDADTALRSLAAQTEDFVI
ncbi:SulP family inorganic anion transporter [Piscinibacter sakaiensis]|uniref:SulP family inorganic anion transporter n=1 Tax=Piscinibacter sakaiensis TaxID=1547922 RepID=UPI003AAC2382